MGISFIFPHRMKMKLDDNFTSNISIAIFKVWIFIQVELIEMVAKLRIFKGTQDDPLHKE